MHALIFRFVQQGSNPAFVVFYSSQRRKVLKQPSHHPWDRRHRFQHHRAIAVTTGEKLIRYKAQNLHKSIGDAVNKSFRFAMRCRALLVWDRDIHESGSMSTIF